MMLLFVLLVPFLYRHVGAIEVAPNSDCATLCMNNPSSDPALTESSNTVSTALACNDWELYGDNATTKGTKFKNCLECENGSTHFDADTGENDVYWFLCTSAEVSRRSIRLMPI